MAEIGVSGGKFAKKAPSRRVAGFMSYSAIAHAIDRHLNLLTFEGPERGAGGYPNPGIKLLPASTSTGL